MRRSMSILAALNVMALALTGGLLAVGGSAHAANNGVRIANYGTGKCLTVRHASTVSFTPVVQWRCDEIPGQRWIFLGSPGGIRQVYNLETSLCMRIQTFANAGRVVQADCGSGDAGLFWSITDMPAPFPQRKITLRSYTMDFCLDLSNGDILDGVEMQVWRCNPSTNNQIWKVYLASTA